MSGSISSVNQFTASIASSVNDAKSATGAFSNVATRTNAADVNLDRLYISKKTGQAEVSSNVFSHFLRKLSGHTVGGEALRMSIVKEYGHEALKKLDAHVLDAARTQGDLNVKDFHKFLEALCCEPEIKDFDEDDDLQAAIWQGNLRSPEGEGVEEKGGRDSFMEKFEAQVRKREEIASQNRDKYQALIQSLPPEAKAVRAEWKSAQRDTQKKFDTYNRLNTGEAQRMHTELKMAKVDLENAQKREPTFKADMAKWMEGIKDLAKQDGTYTAKQIWKMAQAGNEAGVREAFVTTKGYEKYKDNSPSGQALLQAKIAKLEPQVTRTQEEIQKANNAWVDARRNEDKALNKVTPEMAAVLRMIDHDEESCSRPDELAKLAQAVGLEFSPIKME